MLRLALLLAALVLPSAGQSQAVRLAGLDLKLGMPRETVLSMIATRSDLKVKEVGPAHFAVAARSDGKWEAAGDIVFVNDRLSRIGVVYANSNSDHEVAFADALYSAVSKGEDIGHISTWTETNADPIAPTYRIHFLFKDREVVIGTTRFKQIRAATVETYYPRLRTGKTGQARPGN